MKISDNSYEFVSGYRLNILFEKIIIFHFFSKLTHLKRIF
jgi:hypothetical protein